MNPNACSSSRHRLQLGLLKQAQPLSLGYISTLVRSCSAQIRTPRDAQSPAVIVPIVSRITLGAETLLLRSSALWRAWPAGGRRPRHLSSGQQGRERMVFCANLLRGLSCGSGSGDTHAPGGGTSVRWVEAPEPRVSRVPRRWRREVRCEARVPERRESVRVRIPRWRSGVRGSGCGGEVLDSVSCARAWRGWPGGGRGRGGRGRVHGVRVRRRRGWRRAPCGICRHRGSGCMSRLVGRRRSAASAFLLSARNICDSMNPTDVTESTVMISGISGDAPRCTSRRQLQLTIFSRAHS
jgi:hypothetical protein